MGEVEDLMKQLQLLKERHAKLWYNLMGMTSAQFSYQYTKNQIEDTDEKIAHIKKRLGEIKEWEMQNLRATIMT